MGYFLAREDEADDVEDGKDDDIQHDDKKQRAGEVLSDPGHGSDIGIEAGAARSFTARAANTRRGRSQKGEWKREAAGNGQEAVAIGSYCLPPRYIPPWRRLARLSFLT